MTRPPDPSEALRAMATALAPLLVPLILEALRGATSAPLVDIAAAVPASRRSLYRAARAGEIAGAVRVARRWCAPRESLDAWLRARGPRLVEAPEDERDELERVRARLAAGNRKSQRRKVR